MSAMPMTSEEFRTQVLEGKKTALVEFMAPWCVYCRRLGPSLDKVAAEREDSLLTAKIDIDQSPELAEKYRIELVPTLMVFKNGEEVGRVINPESKAKIDLFLSQKL